MSLEWDSRIIAVEGGIDINKSPRKYTYKIENFCPFCNCPRSHVEKLKNINKKFHKLENQFLVKHLQDNNLKLFEMYQLIDSLNAKFLTDGSFQNKQMTLLVLKGLYKRERQEYIEKKETKKGVKELKKFRWIFTKNWLSQNPICYNPNTDSHIPISKDQWIKTNYFDEKAVKKEEEDDG